MTMMMLMMMTKSLTMVSKLYDNNVRMLCGFSEKALHLEEYFFRIIQSNILIIFYFYFGSKIDDRSIYQFLSISQAESRNGKS